MRLTRNINTVNIMNQPQETGLTKGSYLERLLQEQHHQLYQQNIQQQFRGERNANEIFNNDCDLNVSNNDSIHDINRIGRSSGSASISSGNSRAKSSALSFSHSRGIGIYQQQSQQQQQQQHQNRMMKFLQERKQQQLQQQHFAASGIIGGPSDLPSSLGLTCLPVNVGIDARVGSGGIGTRISQSNWLDGLSGGGNGTGIVANAGGLLYSMEQELLLGSQRYPLLGGSGANRLKANVGVAGSIGDVPLTSNLGGLHEFSFPHQIFSSSQASLNARKESNRKNFTDMLLAKQAQAVFLQATQVHLPRTIRLPCGARGMKADHNASTAYFDVPENARHGQHLLCSHSVCRSAGVKFRYCFYCKKPVTKQNFRSRHLHANLDPNNKTEKQAGKQNVRSKGETEKTEKRESEMKTPNLNENTSSNNITQKLKKPMTDGDEKDSIESLGGFDINSNEKRVCCIKIEDDLERRSKIPKLGN